jgi:hypothetical protein
MAAGRLASSKPAATTNTTLYSCPIGYAASVVLNVCNQSSSATSYRVALRNYTQIITTTGSSHTFNRGNPISTYRLTLSPGIPISGFNPGDTYTDTNSKWSLKMLDVVKDTSIITVNTRIFRVGTITYNNISPALTTFSVGNTITDSTSGLTAKVVGVDSLNSQVHIQLEPLSTVATSLKLASAPVYITAGANQFLAIPSGTSFEIVRISAWTPATYTATIVRAQQGTTAAKIPVAANSISLSLTATTKTINEGASFSSTDTTLTLNNVTGLFTGDYLKIGNEFLLVQVVDSGTSTVNVLRGQLSSTAATHADGATVTRVANNGNVFVNYFGTTPTPAPATKNYTLTANMTNDFVFAGDATGNDPTITVNIGDTLTFVNNVAGAPLHIMNTTGAYNVANVVTTGITNDGADGGETLTWDTTGLAAGTYFYLNEFQSTMQGQIILVTPSSDPTISNGTSTARVSTSASAYMSYDEFVHDFNGDSNFEWTPNGFSLNLGRIYRFDQSDSTNTSQPFRFSDQQSLTPLYTTGVTTSGTPGSAGAFTQIDLTASSPTVLYSLSTAPDDESYGSSFTINNDPAYTQIFVYDVTATPTVSDTFTSGITTSTTQTISAVQPGPYGYVQEFSGTTLKISLGNKSTAFASYTTSITGTSGQFTITVGSNANLAVGMAVTGTGVATGAKITNIVGTTVTLDIANTGAVSGTGTFNFTFLDTPLTIAGIKTTATVSSVSEIDVADYILYDKSISGNTTDKNTGIVVGPGSSIMVYSTANSLSYVVNGFEDVTSDWTTVQYRYRT